MDAIVREHKLDARFQIINPRLPHRERVNLALKQGNGAGEVLFHGVSAVAVDGVPIAKPLNIVGERNEQNSDKWRRVVVQCQPDKTYQESQEVGVIGVDYARMLVADVDVLGSWKHEESIDGMADYLFWGRDAEQIASNFQTPLVANREFGWVDIPIEQTVEHGIAVQEYRDKHSLKIAVDFRPHSHHWQVMRAVRENNPTESSTTEIDGEKLCNFMTTWGDGLFQVYRDLDSSGDLVQIRIEMETMPNISCG